MKEQTTGGHHGNVATGTSSTRSEHGRTPHSASDNNNGPKCFAGPCLDSEEEEEDWEEDLGIGKLVIDLDADADKTRSPPSVKSTAAGHNTPGGSGGLAMNVPGPSPQKSAAKPVIAVTNASPQKSSTKSAMESSLAHSGDKGLKMKIKRSGSGKSTASLTSTPSVVSSVAGANSMKQDNRQDVKPNDNRLGFSGGTEGSAGNPAALQNTVDRIKHSLAERDRSATSSGKNRSNSKKDRSSKSKGGGSNDVAHAAGVGTFPVSAPASTQPVSIATTSTASFGTPSSTVTSNVTVDLDRISMTPFGSGTSVKRENPSHDPYEFNAKVEDRIGVPMKKMKVEKVIFLLSSCFVDQQVLSLGFSCAE